MNKGIYLYKLEFSIQNRKFYTVYSSKYIVLFTAINILPQQFYVSDINEIYEYAYKVSSKCCWRL